MAALPALDHRDQVLIALLAVVPGVGVDRCVVGEHQAEYRPESQVLLR